jgi:hypothetical protein
LDLTWRWQSEPSLIDTMGRVLGAAAIATGLFALIEYGI